MCNFFFNYYTNKWYILKQGLTIHIITNIYVQTKQKKTSMEQGIYTKL